MVAPCKILLMDEISTGKSLYCCLRLQPFLLSSSSCLWCPTGLDSSTTFQVVRALQDFAHYQQVRHLPIWTPEHLLTVLHESLTQIACHRYDCKVSASSAPSPVQLRLLHLIGPCPQFVAGSQ